MEICYLLIIFLLRKIFVPPLLVGSSPLLTTPSGEAGLSCDRSKKKGHRDLSPDDPMRL